MCRSRVFLNSILLRTTRNRRDLRTMDPYEQQLLNVFVSYDLDNKGSLDKDALTQLCQTLQLEEQTNELIRALLPERNLSCRATFAEFKDALLAILGNLQNSNSNKGQRNQNAEVDNNSPEREVSPKLVYGSKRYGRRSKPKLDGTPTKQQNDMNYLNKTTNVQRSNSQCETASKKRKPTNAKVKRCTSFPGNNDYLRPVDKNKQQSHSGDEQQQFICTEEMLREAWKNLGVGTDGFLNQRELILVCDAIGLHQLANGVLRQLSDKLTVDCNHKISFQELLEILQQDETWSDLLNNTITSSQNSSKITQSDMIVKAACVTVISDDNSSVKYISLGPDGTGVIAIDLLLELWETAGISSPKSLLNDLGFNEHVISVSKLATVLDKEIKSMNDSHTDNISSHFRHADNLNNSFGHNQVVSLLQATVALYQTEIRCARQLLTQVKAEREKLRTDVTEANKRADLLAHEVDDNHARMERNVQQQIKTMEQKHIDVLRQASAQSNADKEHISTLNQNLQEKIDCLEHEELKLRNELKSAQFYANSLERDNHTMVLQIGELNNAKQNLSDQVLQLENEKMSGEASQKLEVLVSQLSALHVKNSQLRDRNDEMASEIQNLNREISLLRGVNSRKQDLFNNLDDSMNCSSTNDLSETLLGKNLVDTFDQNNKSNLNELSEIQPMLQLQHSTSESGFETEIDLDNQSNSSLSDRNDCDNSHLYTKIAYLEEVLRQNDIPVPDKSGEFKKATEANSEFTKKNIPKKDDRIIQLQKTKSFFYTVLAEVKDKDVASNLEVQLTEFLKNLSMIEENDEISMTFQTEIKTLKDHCNDLELCIEQLRTEYERCEDYWSAKLDEERNMFDQENSQNSEKLTELMLKLTDFEAQYDVPDSRLPIIDEKGALEKQYMDLEEEYEEFKTKIIKDMEDKNALLEKLIKTTKTVEASAQTDSAFERNFILQEKLANLTRNEVEATNLFSYNENASSIQSGSSQKLKQVELNQTPCRPRRTRHLYNKKVEAKSQQANFSGSGNQVEEPTCTVSINTIHNLKVRLHLLDQKNRHLQSVVKQQHWQHDRISQYYWQQHRSEKAEYHYSLKIVQEQLDFQLRLCNDYLDKLSRCDFLVKDLYVENAYLVAKVERLQGQCHLLANHYSDESSSV